jgi:hypothetical protein
MKALHKSFWMDEGRAKTAILTLLTANMMAIILSLNTK